MKIGILTFHSSVNPGAYLQAYGTYKFLEDEGFQSFIIDYRNQKHLFNEYKAFFIKKNPIKILQNVKKVMVYHRALKNFRKTQTISNNKCLKNIRMDATILGSDIIWNFQNPWIEGDFSYFGNNIRAKKIISYAPSVGSADINSPIPNTIRILLNKHINAISVRDKKTQKFVQKHTSKDVKLVLDPTLIYSFDKEIYTPNISQKYILVYAHKLNSRVKRNISNCARKNNFLTVSIVYPQDWCDINTVAVHPFEFLGYIKNAEYIITSTFHGTVLSIKYGKNFSVLYHDNTDSKLSTTLEKLGLENRIAKNETIQELIKKPINYDPIDKLLSKLITSSRKWLLKNLS